MFIKSPAGRTYFNCDLKTTTDVIEFVCKRDNLPNDGRQFWRVEQGGKFLEGSSEISSAAGTLHVIPGGGLRGGKGGFGSLLRAIGAQIQKTTNHEAMRDLSGRRQRDVNNEQRVREYAAKQGEREREEREKKEAKMSKLKRLAERENKHEFSDPQYDKVRSETEEKVHDAMEAAMKAVSDKAKEEEKQEVLKRKADTDKKTEPPKKKGMWMGDGLEGLSDEELTDSDEDSEETNESNTVAVM